MAGGNYIEIQYNHIPTFSKTMKVRIAAALDRGAADIEQTAGNNAPFKTGALRASRFRITPLTNTFEAAKKSAIRQNPMVRFTEPPIVEPNEAYVGFAVDYAGIVHEGTHRMAARPFLMQAVEARKAAVVDYIIDALNGAAVGGTQVGSPPPAGAETGAI